MVQLARDLAEARYAAQIARLESQSDALEARVSAASQLRGQFSQLAAALGDRIRTGDLAPQPSIGNAAVATVSVAPGANPRGTYSLEVTQLARGQMLALAGPASAADPVGEGTLTIRFGQVTGASFTADACCKASTSALCPLPSASDATGLKPQLFFPAAAATCSKAALQKVLPTSVSVPATK